MYGDIPAEGITIRVPNPPKTALLRLPTNQEMLDRLDQQKSIRRTIGRRKSQTEFVPNPKADLDLFNKIRLDKGGAEFDEFEAGNAISKLTFCEVTDCQRAGDEYRVTLRTPFGDDRPPGEDPDAAGHHRVPAHGGVLDRSPARPGGVAVPDRAGGGSVRFGGHQDRGLRRSRSSPPMSRRITSRRSSWSSCRPSTTSTRRSTQTPSAGRVAHAGPSPVVDLPLGARAPSCAMAAPTARAAAPTPTTSPAESAALVRTVEDTNAPGACPQCGGWQFTVNRCAHCKLDDLDYARTHSNAGRLFERLLELEFDAAHFSIPWTDVTAEEVRGLQILKEERDRYQREQAQKPPHAFPDQNHARPVRAGPLHRRGHADHRWRSGDSISARIRKALNVNDAPAKALKPGRNGRRGYPDYKAARGLNADPRLGVDRADHAVAQGQERQREPGVIGFIDPNADRIAHVNNLRERQFGVSPKDRSALSAAVRAVLRQARVIRIGAA